MIRLSASWWSPWPQTIRLRLAVRYAALVFVAGCMLLALTYGLVAHSLAGAALPRSYSPAQVLGARQYCQRATPGAVPKCVVGYLSGTKPVIDSWRQRTLHSLLQFSLAGLVAITLFSGAIGWSMADRVLRPIRAITRTARRASEVQLGERVALAGPADELKDLADAFDSMLDRLDDAFAGQRAFIANASHELRTPLTSMRTAIDVALAKRPPSLPQLQAMGTSVRASVDEAETLIDSLLTLAKSQRGDHAEEFVDLATACEDSLEQAAAQIKRRELQITAALEPAELTGDRVLLERMVGNLVDNAARYATQGGWVKITSGRLGDHAYVEVANSSEPLPEDLVPLLIEPFRRVTDRVGDSRGAGLGLAIVKAVADLHHGTVTLQAGHGGGLSVVIRIPVSPPGPAFRAISRV